LWDNVDRHNKYPYIFNSCPGTVEGSEVRVFGCGFAVELATLQVAHVGLDAPERMRPSETLAILLAISSP
jgi:hypothetical protein